MKTTTKKRLARKLMSIKDRKENKGPFNTLAWVGRRSAIAKRVEKRQAEAHVRAIKRRN